MSEPRYTFVVISSDDSTASRVLLAGSSSNLNAGVTTAQQGLLVPSPTPTTLPALSAAVYYKPEYGAPILVSPTPPVLWELACGSRIATIDPSSGIITRHSNPDDLAYDSNGLTTSSGLDNAGIGGLIQVSCTVLRSDGSKSGCVGYFSVAIQSSSARQFAAVLPGHNEVPADASANNTYLAAGFYGDV
jgi:hypothetical protein